MITISGLATDYGFSALLATNFPMLSNFGVMAIFAVVFILIGAIVVWTGSRPGSISAAGRRHRQGP